MTRLPDPPVEDLAPGVTAAQRRAMTHARTTDALRLLPCLGLGLFLLPDLILSGEPAVTGATAPWLIYLFVAWILLLAVAIWLGRQHLSAMDEAADDPDV